MSCIGGVNGIQPSERRHPCKICLSYLNPDQSASTRNLNARHAAYQRPDLRVGPPERAVVRYATVLTGFNGSHLFPGLRPRTYGDGAAEGVELTLGSGIAGQGLFGSVVAGGHDDTSCVHTDAKPVKYCDTCATFGQSADVVVHRNSSFNREKHSAQTHSLRRPGRWSISVV